MSESTRHHPWLPAGETPCLWMLAGVLTCWLCDRELQCDGCPLDAALRHDVGRAQRLSQRLGAPQDEAAHPRSTPPPRPEHSLREALEVPLPPLDPQALYTRHHTWVRAHDDGLVRLGIDAFAARIVGRLRCVVLPLPGTLVRRGHACAWLDQPGGTLTVLAPVSGHVVAGNATVTGHHDFEIQDAQGEDWLLTLHPLRFRSESKALLDASAFAAQVDEDLEVWRQALQHAREQNTPAMGETLADGGVAVRTPAELLGRGAHHRLANRFLQPLVQGRRRRQSP